MNILHIQMAYLLALANLRKKGHLIIIFIDLLLIAISYEKCGATILETISVLSADTGSPVKQSTI